MELGNLLIEKVFRESFVFWIKVVPLQAEYYQKCTKSLVFSTLLRPSVRSDNACESLNSCFLELLIY